MAAFDVWLMHHPFIAAADHFSSCVVVKLSFWGLVATINTGFRGFPPNFRGLVFTAGPAAAKVAEDPPPRHAADHKSWRRISFIKVLLPSAFPYFILFKIS